MPTAATGSVATRPRGDAANAPASAAVPFVRASAEHRESIFDITRQLLTSEQDLSVFDIPAYGYVRAIVLHVQATGGAATGAVATEDGPWNVLRNIALTEPNGAVIQQFGTGHDLYLANKWGGYRDADGADFKASPTYSPVVSINGNFSFMVRVPVELNLRDGLGSLPNQNAAAQFKLRLSLARIADVLGGTITTAPTVRVRAYLEAWDQPEIQSGGLMNQVNPPAMNTTQFWTATQINYAAGQQTLKFSRVGNYVRNLILIARRANGTRAQGDADFPDPATLTLDVRPLDTVDKASWKHQMFERTGFSASAEQAKGLDNGVFVYDFTHEFDGSLGRENRDLWLPTLTSTRLELVGNFANAGTLTVLTNDVAVAGSVFI